MRPARRTHVPASGKMAAMPNKLLPAAFIAGALACAIAAAGCTSGGSAGPAGPASSPAASPAGGTGQAGELHWHPCPVQSVPMQCASLQVPLTTATRPGGRSPSPCRRCRPPPPPRSSRVTCSSTRAARAPAACRWPRSVAPGLDPTVASEYNIIGFDPRGVGSSVPALHCDPSFFAGVQPDYIPANAQRRAGAARAGEELRRRLPAPVRLAAAVHDHGRHGAGHGFHPGRPGRAEDQLLRLLLGHLPGAGVRDPVPAPAAPDGARQRREPAGCLVRRQHRPGLRVRGPDTGVLLLDRRPRRRLPPRLHPGPGPAGVVPGAGQARGAPDRRPDRPDDRPRRVRRHLPGGRLHQRRVAGPGHRAVPPTSASTTTAP